MRQIEGTEKIISGELNAAKIFARKFDGKIEIELGLWTDKTGFIEDSDHSFNAHWLEDLICVLNRTKAELNDTRKYQKRTTTTINGKTVTEYRLKAQ